MTGDRSTALVDRVRAVLDRHPVAFAMVFGSGARDAMDGHSDLDVAVEFDGTRPDDDGYSDLYLSLYADLDRSLQRSIDLVDVHTMPPGFARVAFDEGAVLVGSESRRAELERRLAGDRPSLEEARSRVDAAVQRLREGSSR